MNLSTVKNKIIEHLTTKSNKVEIEYDDGLGYVITYYKDGFGKGAEIDDEIISDLIEELNKDKKFKIKSEDRFGDMFYRITIK